jgi:hypothetical protein
VLQPEVGSARAYRGGLAGGGQAARGEFVIALKAEAGDEIVWISSERRRYWNSFRMSAAF